MFKFELNREGVAALLKSQEMMNECQSRAAALAARDTGENTINTRVGRSRVCAEIVLTGENAMERKGALSNG